MFESFIYGNPSAGARTVLLHGNCQVPYLARMLAALDDLNESYRFVVALNHPQPGQSEPEPVPEKFLGNLALVLWQHEMRDGPTAAALRGRVPPTVPSLSYPSYLFTCLWPFECPEPRAVPEPDYPWSRFPTGDMLGLEIAATGLTGPLAVAAYMDLSLAKMPNLDVRYERDVARMRQHDAHCDVRLSDYVESAFRREHLFWMNGHVSRAGVLELAARVADAARPVLGGSAVRARACFERAADYDGMGGLQLPIHPLVAEKFGLDYAGPDRTWQWYGQQWNFFEYMERYIPYDREW